MDRNIRAFQPDSDRIEGNYARSLDARNCRGLRFANRRLLSSQPRERVLHPSVSYETRRYCICGNGKPCAQKSRIFQAESSSFGDLRVSANTREYALLLERSFAVVSLQGCRCCAQTSAFHWRLTRRMRILERRLFCRGNAQFNSHLWLILITAIYQFQALSWTSWCKRYKKTILITYN